MASTGIAQKYADQVKKGQEYINSQSQENTQTGSVPYGSSLTEAVENLRKAEEAAAARGNQEYIEVVSKRREQEAAEAAAKGETYTPDNTILSNSILTPTIAGAPDRTKNGAPNSVSEKYKEDVGLSEDSHIYKQAAQVNGEIQAGGEATNLKRQNKEFKLDKHAWADTEGTTGSKRNETDADGAYHWEGHYDEKGNWVSGVTEWVQDDQARLQANINDYKNTVDNELFLTEEEVQAKQQECANIHYDVGELVEYTQAVVDEFKAKYDQTYASASDEEKKELDEKLADYNNELEVYKSWQDTSKEMYDLWSGLNDLYSTADDNKMADVTNPKYYQDDQYGGNTPEIIQIQIENLDAYIKVKKAELNEKTASGQYAPSELDPLRAEIKDKESQSTNLQKDLELANARKAQLEQDNSEFDLKRKYIFTNSTEKWQNAYVKLNTALAEAQAAGNEAEVTRINREIQYVLKNEEVYTKKDIYDEYMAQENGKYVVSDDALNKAIAELSPGAEKPLINTQPTVLTRSADEIQAEMAKLDPVKDWEKYEALRKEYAAVTTGKQIDDAIESVTEQKPLTDAEQWKLDALLDIKEMREMEAYFQNNYKDADRAEAARKWKEDAEDKYDKAMAAFVEAKEPTNRHGAAPAIDLYNQLFKRDENNAAISAAQAQLEAATKELDYATTNYFLNAAADKNLKVDAAKGMEKAPSLKNLQDAFTTVKKPRLEFDNKKDLGVLAGLGFTGEEAHELLKVLNTLGTSAMDFLPRTAQTTAGETATHLDAHGQTARNWTQLELDTYYAIYEREGAVSATKYAARVNSLIGSEYHNQVQQNMLDAKMYEAQHGKGAFLGEALISPWVTNPLNITALGDFAATTSQIGTLGFDVQGVNFTPYELANMVNEVTTNVVTSTAKRPELASFLYNSYNSAVGSVESAGVGSALGAGVSSALKLGSEAVIFGDSVAQAIARGYTGLSFFGSAAMSSYEQFKQSGVDPTRAWQAALASGLFESFFEDMSFDKIYDAINGSRIFTGFLDFAGNLAVGAGIEASEEVLTEAANNLSERILLGKDSPFWVSVNNYHDSMGMSYVEAYKKALMDEGKDVALAAASAILSTLGSQGVPSALHYAPYAKSTNVQAKVYGQKINGVSEDVQGLGKKLGEFYSKYEFTKDGQAIKVPSGQQGNLERLHALAEKAKNGTASEKEIGKLVMLAKAMDANTFYSFVGDNLSAWAQVSIGDIGAAADIALGAVIGDKNVFPFRIAQSQNPDAVVEDTFVTGLRKADSSLSHDDALKIESFLSGILTGSKTMTEEQLRDLIGRIFQNDATRNYIKGYIQEKVQQYQETGMTDFSWAAVVSPDLITDDFTKMMVNIWSGIQRVEESQAVYNAALAEAMEEQFIHDVETGKSENRFAKGLAANRSDMDAIIIGDRVITRKDFVATAVNEGKNLFTGEKFDTGNGNITENQAQAFFDGRIFAYAGVDSSKGIAYAEKFNLRTGEALTEEQIARGRERFYRLVNGEAPQAEETQQQGYKLPDNAVPYKQPWLQSDEAELEQKIAVLTNELVELTNNSRHLLSGEAREQREAQIKAKEAQLINYRRDLDILRGRRSSNGTLSSGTQERIGNADGRADAGAVSEGRVGSSEGAANDSTGARALPGGVQGVSGENVQSESGRVELPSGYFIEDGQVLYDSDSSENTDNLTSEEKAILEAAKKAGAERVVFVYSSAIKTPGGGTLAGYENRINGKRTIVLNTNTDLRNGTHEIRHISMERLQELSQAASKKAGYGLTVREAYTTAFVAEVFKGREGLLGQLVAYYAEKNKGAFKNRTEEEFYAYLCEEIFCDLTSPDGLDRMSMIEGVSVISPEEMKELHTLAMAYLNASGLQEYIDAGGKNKKGTSVSFAAFNNARAKAGQTTETKADTGKTQETKKEEKKKPTIPSKKQTEEKQKAKEEAKVQEQKAREFFVFLQQQSENYDILPFLNGASDYALQYIAGLTGTTDVEKTVIRAAKNELAKRQATDNAAEETSEKEDQRGAHELSDEEILERIDSLNKDVINNDSVPEEAKATAREAVKILQEEYDKRQKAKPVKPADIKTEENLRATDNKNPNTDKNGVSYIEKRKWTDTIQNPAKGDKETKTITRAKFVARAMAGDTALLSNVGYSNPLTAAEANDLFDEIRADERSKKKDNKQGRNSVITEADEVEQQARYSVLDAEHNGWAPVFYSQMQRTIDEWTNNSGKPIPGKLGANQVVSWLKGKGVKKEEIKWSGVEQFLEGKKSVTRAELLQFMAENEYPIETKLLQDNRATVWRYLDPTTNELREVDRPESALPIARRYVEEEMGLDPDAVVFDAANSSFMLTAPNGLSSSIIRLRPRLRLGHHTVWSDFVLPDGENYREILFKNPLSTYSNQAMETHWGKVGEKTGVLAHARIDDMYTETAPFTGLPKKVLFIEEIQSDWHNRLAKAGYSTEERDRLADLMWKHEFDRSNMSDKELEDYYLLYDKYIAPLEEKVNSLRDDATASDGYLNEVAEEIFEDISNNYDWDEAPSVKRYANEEPLSLRLEAPRSIYNNLINEIEYTAKQLRDLGLLTDEQVKNVLIARRDVIAYKKAAAELKDTKDGLAERIPNAPFAGSSDTYHEYVMKHLLRMAAEGDYDKIGWTNSQQQVDRWAEDYAKGYAIEYDQAIPKFMDKYCKQWGAKVDTTTLENGETVWSVDITPQMKEDVLTNGQPRYSILEEGEFETAEDGQPAVTSSVPGLGLEGRYSRILENMPYGKQNIRVSDSSVTKTTRLSDNGELYLTTVRELRNEAFRKNPWLKETFGEKGMERVIGEINSFMDRVGEEITKAGEEFHYLGLEDLANATLKLDPVTNTFNLTAMIPNGEYEINFDFGTICERRAALQQIVDSLLDRATYDDTGAASIKLDENTIMELNKALQREGINTQCLICFVETKRFNQAEGFIEFTTLWNNEVKKALKGKEAKRFDFEHGTEELSEERIQARREAIAHADFSGTKENAVKDFVQILAEYSPEDLQLLTLGDISSSTGRTNIIETFPEINTLIMKSGSSAPKPVYAFTPYNGEIESMTYTGKKYQSLKDYVKSLGGIRSQSFSDFIISHVFDHLQKTAGLAAMDLPAHTYTKVLARAVLFGMTGEKINTSILCGLTRNVGSWYSGLNQEVTDWNFNTEDHRDRPYLFADARAYKQGEAEYIQSFPWDEAVEYSLKEGYAGNVGPIVVGLSYWHNMLLQRDPFVAMVIAYHSSSMPKNVKQAMGVGRAADYTKVQNVLKLVTEDEKKVSKKTGKETITKHFGLYRPNYNIPDGVPSYATPPQSIGKKKGASAKYTAVSFDSFKDEKTRQRAWDIFHNGNIAEAFDDYLAEHGDMSESEAARAYMVDMLEFLNEQGLTLDTKKAETGHGKFDLYGDLEQTQDPYETSDNFIAYCLRNNEIPMFYEFLPDINYFKRVFDFTVFDPRSYNPKSGRYEKYAPQESVKLVNENGELLLPHEKDEDAVDGFIRFMRQYMGKYNTEQEAVYNLLNSEDFMNEAWDIVEGRNSVLTPEEAAAQQAKKDAQLAVNGPKAVAHNNAQTETGSMLRTRGGFSPISRGGSLKGKGVPKGAKYRLGKVIGGSLYIHKNYLETAFEDDPRLEDDFNIAEELLREKYPDFEYNCIAYYPETHSIQFQAAPGFDTEREPAVGDMVNVNAATGEVNPPKYVGQIWHHKWLWVDNDYTGFNVRNAWEWSRTFLNSLNEPSIGGSINSWNRQLDKYGLPHDEPGEGRFSLVSVEPVQPSSDKWHRTLTQDEAQEEYHKKSGGANLWGATKEAQEESDRLIEEYQNSLKAREKEVGHKLDGKELEDFQEDYRNKKHPTQRGNTVATYSRIFNLVKLDNKEGFHGRILDASSGLGYGTALGREMFGDEVVDDIEPFPAPYYEPRLGRDYSKVFGKYDVIISSAVLNVCPQDQRDALVVKMGQMLNPDGKMYITTRAGKNDVDNLAKPPKDPKTKPNVQLGEHEFVESKHGAYQYGFTKGTRTIPDELQAYIQDVLGSDFKVETTDLNPSAIDPSILNPYSVTEKHPDPSPFSNYGNPAVIVTRVSNNGTENRWNKKNEESFGTAEDENGQYRIDFDSENTSTARHSVLNSEGEELSPQQIKYFANSKVRDENGNLLVMYHGTDSYGFTVFDPQYTDDKRSLFLTSDPDVARSYINGLNQDVRSAMEIDNGAPVKELPLEEKIDLFNLTSKKERIFRSNTLQGYLDEQHRNITRDYLELYKDMDNLRNPPIRDFLQIVYDAFTEGGKYRRLSEEELNNLKEKASGAKAAMASYSWRDRSCIDWIVGAFEQIEKVEDSSLPRSTIVYVRRSEDANGYFSFYFSTQEELEEELKGIESKQSGIYPVYVNVVNPLVIDAERHNWNNIPIPREIAEWLDNLTDEEARFYTSYKGKNATNTRGLSKYAKEHNYDGVIIKNLRDNGAAGYRGSGSGFSTVAIAFNSDQIKDIGNKNPTHNPDMRYSVLTPEDNKYMDAVNSDDMETAQKIVDKAAKKAGYKKHAYHGTLAYGFNEFRMISTRELGVHFGTEDAARVFYNNTYKRRGYGETPGIYNVYLKMENTLKTPDVWGDPEALDTIIRRVDSWVENGYNEHRQGAEDVRWTKADSKKLRDALKINDDYYAYRDACDAWWDETQRYEKTDEFVDPVTRKVYTEEEAWDLAEAEATKLGLTRSYRKNDDKTKYYASDSNHRHETLLFTLEPSYQGTPIQERIDAAAWKANQLAQTYLLNLGFDSIRYINEMEDIGSESYIILKPGNIKRADPVTYDDDGNIIPPSQRFDDESKDMRYSVLNGVVTQDGKIYNHVIRLLYPYDKEVMQDPDHFDNYVRQVFQGAYITTLDQNGEKQDIQFVTDEKVIKHNFEHPGISELAYGRKTGRSSWLVYLNAKEIFDNSRFDRHEPQNKDWWNNHDWFDEGGWDKRTAYILDKNYTMYPVQLFIANTRDGRKIFYHAAVMTPAGVPIDVAATAANNPQENFRRRMQTLPKPAGYKSLDELEAERAEEQREADEAALRGTEDRYSIIEDSAQYDGVEDEAIKHFGTTGSYRSAGYILEDGQMLDFSGLHWEGDLSPAEKQARRSYYDSRYVDHGDIFEAFEKISDNYPSDAGLAFMTRGNIRIVPETPGLEMSAYVEPTAKQYARIKDYIRTADRGAGGLDSGYFAIDFTTDRRRRPEVLKYEGKLNPDRIINDIKSFYRTGEVPQQSVVSKFHNSVDEFGNGRLSVISDDEYLRAVESGDMETAQAMVDEAARAAGYDLLGYKGIRGQKQGDEYPFTIFKSRPGGIYLATDRAVADAFSKGYNFNTKRVTTGTVLTLYTKFNNPYILNLNEDNPPAWHQIPTPQDMKEFDPSMGDTTYTEEIGIVAKLMGYDGVIIRNVKEGSGYLTTDYVATSPEQIKLADPVTYYDDGSIIPLSERFDSESPDMRFSVLSPVAEEMKEYIPAAKDADDYIEFWYNLTEEQQEKLRSNYKEVFNSIKEFAGEKDEWVEPSGRIEDMPTPRMQRPKDVELVVKAAKRGEMHDTREAQALPDGIVEFNLNEKDYWNEAVLTHEMGHELSANGLGYEILKNPGGLWGRYNRKYNIVATNDGYIDASPEEMFADRFSHYIMEPDYLRERTPDIYDYFVRLEKANPWIRPWVNSALNKYYEMEEQYDGGRVVKESGLKRVYDLSINPDAVYDEFGEDITLDSFEPVAYQSPLSDNLYYSYDGNTAYYQTDSGETVVLNDIGPDSPEARYINYLEAMNNANSTDTTTTQPYTIPPKARNEADGYNLGESDAGLRRGSEEVSEAYQEGTSGRTGSLGERNGESRSQSEAEESLGARYSILYDPEDDAFYNEYGEPIATPDMYPEGSIQRMLFDMARKGDTSFEELNKAIQKMVEDNGPFEESDYDAIREIIENNPKYTEAQKQAAFKTMEKLIEKHGMHRYTDKDANKDVHFAKKNKKGKTIMKGVQTASRNAPEWLTIQDMRDALSNAAMSYTPMPNDEAIRRAKKIIDQRGYKNALDHFLTIAESGKQPSQVDVALGEILLKEAAAQGAAGDAIKLTANLTIMAHYTGQALQAFNILRKLTPDGQLYYLTKVVDDLNKRYEKRIDNPNSKQKKIEIDTALVEKLLASSTRAELDTVVEEIKQNIADQIPATFADKYNAWRYLAMLGNPKTHVRNMFGNLGFMPAVFIKDIIARRLEGIAYKHGKLEARNRLSHADLSWSSPYMKRAREDFKEMKDILTGKASGSGNKFSDASDIMEKRQIFNNKWFEKLRKANGGALEAEDLGFMWVYYTRAFAEGLQARGIKEDELNDFDTTPEGRKILNEVRAFAVNEAWRDTYHDANKLAQSLNNIKHNTGPLGYVLVEGVMPFTKTPANILKRGIEYSPIGLIQSVMQLRRDLASGDYTTSECLDRMAAGITGTGLILLGAWLSHLGILRGAGPDDDEEDAFEKLQGHQSWALEFGGTSYTIDWMAPTALPLFTGSALDKMFDGEQGFGSFSEWVQLATKLLDPMMSLSMLDGLNNAFSSISNNRTTSALGALALQMGTGYITQAMPTFAGQIARSIDPYDRATFVEYGDKDAWVKRLLQSSFQSKIPGLVEAAERMIGKGDIDIPFTAENRMKRVDNWGRTEKADTVGDWIVKAFENFLSPGYISKINETPVDQEIARVYKATDGASKLPSKGGTYFSYSEDDQSMKKIMNADEYERFATARGQTAYDILDELFLTEEYNDATDIEKSIMIENAFDYANRYAEREIEPKKGLAKWMNTAEKIGVVDYLTIKKELDKNNSQEKLFTMMATETRLDSDQIATIMASKFTAPEYVDSPTEGFRYKLNDEDGDVLYSMNEELLKQGLETLRNDPRYINADEDGRKELLRELYSDTRTQTLANYGQILGRTDRVYTLKNAASIGKEAFTIALDQYNGDFAQQGHWLAGKYRADKAVDNPDHVGYEFEIPEYDKKNVLPPMFDKAYTEAYEDMRRNNKEFIDAWNRGDKDYCSLMAADLYNQTADEVEAEYARQLAASGAKESFKEKPTGYTTYEAFKIAKEKYGDDYEAIGKYVAQAIDNHTTISDPDNPGYVIVLSTAQQEQGKKDRAEMLAKTIANEAKKGTFNVSDEELEPIIKVMAHNVDADYQREFAKKIKDAKYESTKVDISVNADEFYKYMANANFSKEQAIDILMQRFEKTLGIDDVGYNYEVYNFKRDKVREYYEAHYDSMIGTNATAKQWGDFKDKANDYANKLVKSTFGKSVSKVDPSEFDTPAINPSFGLTENATPATTYVVPPATTGTTTTAPATTTETSAAASTDTKPKSQKFVIPPAAGVTKANPLLMLNHDDLQASEYELQNYTWKDGKVVEGVKPTQEEIDQEYIDKGYEPPRTGEVRALEEWQPEDYISYQQLWEIVDDNVQALPGYEDSTALAYTQEMYAGWVDNPDYPNETFEDYLNGEVQNKDRFYKRNYKEGIPTKATRREALNYVIGQAVSGLNNAGSYMGRGSGGQSVWTHMLRRR